jgi:transposase InsO family protein
MRELTPESKVYPYLLGGLSIERVNQSLPPRKAGVWRSDITYIPISKGFLYLVAIMDWHSHLVLARRLSKLPLRTSRERMAPDSLRRCQLAPFNLSGVEMVVSLDHF